jgi:hypothetical protein
MWDAVNGGFQPQPWHHNITQARPYPIFPYIHPHLHMYYSIRMHPYAHPQHLKVLKLFVYPIWMWDAINGGLKPQPWHPNIIQAWPYPIFPKPPSPPAHVIQLLMHPYVHPQHLKVLKLFVYIQYGCGMQSMGVFSLNHDTNTTTSHRLGHTQFFLKLTPTCTCNTA